MEPFGSPKTYGIYCTAATLGRLGRSDRTFFLDCFLGRYFYICFAIVHDFGAKRVIKMDSFFVRDCVKMVPTLQQVATWAQGLVLERLKS